MVRADDERYRRFCPVCLEPVDLGQLMHIAEHPSLTAEDEVLKWSVPQRFWARRFDDDGRALDAMGEACSDLACPHCHRRFPSPLLEAPAKVISVVGETRAGKTYYLCTLIKMLKRRLPEFGLHFTDVDPESNAKLNESIAQLFGATTPEEAFRHKTIVGGDMYEMLERQGKPIRMPKPYGYLLHPKHSHLKPFSLIFYDNAGENFQPGVDPADKPGTYHAAMAAGVLFLFDPFCEPAFKRLIRTAECKDPQLNELRSIQQDVTLREMRLRVQKVRKLADRDVLKTPLAVLVGKYDALQQWIPPEQFQDPLQNGCLDLQAVRRNSDTLRDRMNKLCGDFVAMAEAFSDTVSFFPVSSFGHTPVQIQKPQDPSQPDGSLAESADSFAPTSIRFDEPPPKAKEMIFCAPDPMRLSSFQAEVPVFWILSQIAPNLISLAPPNPASPLDHA